MQSPHCGSFLQISRFCGCSLWFLPGAELHVALPEDKEVQTVHKTPCHQPWAEGADRVGFFLLCSCFFPALKQQGEYEENIVISTFSEKQN